MAITVSQIARLCAELKRDLAGHSIEKLHKDEKAKKITLQFSQGNSRFSLLFQFGMNPSYLYHIGYYNMKIVTTNFLPQLKGAKVSDISSPVPDRIVKIDLECNNKPFVLIFELFGPSSNLYLLNKSDRIITSIRKSSQSTEVYNYPENSGFENSLQIDSDPKSKLYYNLEDKIIISNPDPDYDLQKAESISDIYFQLAQQAFIPRKAVSEKMSALSQIKRSLKKDMKKLDKFQNNYSNALNHADIRRQAEILSAHIHLLTTGLESIQLEDHISADNDMLTIILQKSYSPAKNVESLFKRARKLKATIPILKAEIDKLKSRILFLETMGVEIKDFETEELTNIIREKLQHYNITIQSSSKSKLGQKPERLPYKHYLISSGEEVLVGRSAKDNDLLTFKVARKYDLWLHSQQTSGSHVILRRPNRTHQFQKGSIIEAAQIAAFYSTAKSSGSVPVIYTEVRYVRKTRKGKPGQVLADRTKSVLVVPRRPKN